MAAYEGGCHCGNLHVTFRTEIAPDRLGLRACGCTFCRRHGATWTTDPAGALELRISDPGRLSRYRFGLGTSEFLICRDCGVHVAAVSELDGRTYAALNCNALSDRAVFTQEPTPVDYDAETADGRVSRRRRAWTPATVLVGR